MKTSLLITILSILATGTLLATNAREQLSARQSYNQLLEEAGK